MLPNDGPMQVKNKLLIPPSPPVPIAKSIKRNCSHKQPYDSNKTMIKRRRLSDLQSIGASRARDEKKKTISLMTR
jgi:hypothetical protein